MLGHHNVCACWVSICLKEENSAFRKRSTIISTADSRRNRVPRICNGKWWDKGAPKFLWEKKKKNCCVSVCQKYDGICIQGWEAIHVQIVRRGTVANLNAHCDMIRRLREAIRASITPTIHNRVLSPPPGATMPDHAQQVTNKCLCCRFTGKFWAIHPIVLTLPRLIVICFGRPGRTWLVADSTTSSQWKRRFEIACECRRPISQTTEFELVSRWTDLLICSGIMLKIIFQWKYYATFTIGMASRRTNIMTLRIILIQLLSS